MKNMKKMIYAAIALASVAAPAFATQPDPMYFRRTLYAPAGERQLVLEAPLGMCFLDPSYYAEYRLSGAVQQALDDIDGGQLLGIFTPCLDAAGFGQGSLAKVPVFGLITWLNPQVGETTDMALGAYLDMQEKVFAGTLSDNFSAAASDMEPLPEPTVIAAEDVIVDEDAAFGPEVSGLEEALAELEGKSAGMARFSAGNLPRVPEPGGTPTRYTPPLPDPTKSKYSMENLPRVPEPGGTPTRYEPPLRDSSKSKYSMENMPRVPEPAAGPRGRTIESASLGFAYNALMLPLPAEYNVDAAPHRTGSGVSVGYSADMERDRTLYHTRGVAATTVLKTAPVMVMMGWTQKDLPSESHVRELMDVFLAQQVALNSK